jgi:hypothetical protein
MLPEELLERGGLYGFCVGRRLTGTLANLHG